MLDDDEFLSFFCAAYLDMAVLPFCHRGLESYRLPPPAHVGLCPHLYSLATHPWLLIVAWQRHCTSNLITFLEVQPHMSSKDNDATVLITIRRPPP